MDRCAVGEAADRAAQGRNVNARRAARDESPFPFRVADCLPKKAFPGYPSVT
jgi:hypothetical protein